MKVLIIDPHRSEFFWLPISESLKKVTGWDVILSSGLPKDFHKADIIVKVYLDQMLQELSYTTMDIPIIGISMGTDTIVRAHGEVNSKRIAKVIAFNDAHADFVKDSFPFSDVVRCDWPANDEKLAFYDRPKYDKGALVLANIALHQYSKGLDNLVQMLADVDTSWINETFLKPIDLHVIGGVGPFGDYNQYLNYFVAWFAKQKPFSDKVNLVLHGEVHPTKIDSLVESIKPHGYITASQGEAGATTVAEGLIKGLKVIVHDHPFRENVYPNDVPNMYIYHTAATLSEQLKKAFITDEPNSIDASNYARYRFNLQSFVIKLADTIKEAVNK